MKCKNCGYEVEGNFCSQCGQKSSVGRITFSSFLNEISATVFMVNHGFVYTLIELFTRPGKTLNEFLDGKRKSHFKPIAYLLVLSTFYLLITRITEQSTLTGALITGWAEGASEQISDYKVPKIVEWLVANYAYLALLLVPVFSLASFIAFRKYSKTYLEHMVVNSYITGQQAIIYSFMAVLATIWNSDVVEILSFVLGISYPVWVFWQLFSEGNRIMIIVRSIFTYLVYIVLSTLVLGLLTL